MTRSDTRPCHFVLTLRPVPTGPDHLGREPLYRMKRFLKRLLRDCGMRCVEFRAVEAADGKERRPTP